MLIFLDKKFIVTSLFIFLIFSYAEAEEKKAIYINENCFYIEIADTPNERSRGLMFRTYMAPNEGMLFIFEEEQRHPFWMKNVSIPLDIIWINKDKEIVFIEKNIPFANGDKYPVIYPDRKAMFVLELNAGVADEIGLRLGDKLDF